MTLELTYFDQNESFAQSLPRQAAVQRTYRSSDGKEWFLLALDRPLGPGVPHGASTFDLEHVLVASRWRDCEVGGSEPTSVFIVLIPKSSFPLKKPLDVTLLHHVAWGMISKV